MSENNTKIEKYEALDRSQLNEDQVETIARRGEVGGNIKELEAVLEQLTLLEKELQWARDKDLAVQQRAELEKQNALDWVAHIQKLTFAFSLPLSSLVGAHSVTEGEFNALLAVKSRLFEGKNLEEFVAFAQNAHLQLFTRNEENLFPGTELTYCQVNDLIVRLLSPQTEPKFGMFNAPATSEVSKGLAAAPAVSPAVQMPAFPTVINFLNPAPTAAATPDPPAPAPSAHPPASKKSLKAKKPAATPVPLVEGNLAAPVESAPAAEKQSGEKPKKKKFRKPNLLALKLTGNSLPSSTIEPHITAKETTSLKDMLLNDLSALKNLISKKLKSEAGQVLFEVGLEDDGASMDLSVQEYQKCLENIRTAAASLDADATILYERNTSTLATSSSHSSTAASSAVSDAPNTFAHILIRQRPGNVEDLSEVRICVTGNVDAGKSTLLGVLTKNTLDDGRGKARVNLFRFKHELESGRTSSVGTEVMGFDSTGSIVTAGEGKQKLGMEEICTASSKVVTFLDLAGHEKYLKTTVFGMTGCSPDFVMLMIGANAGVIGMTKEHLGLALALQVPVYIVITKIDMCPANVLESTILQLTKILKSSGCRKIPLFINNLGDVLISSGSFISERVCPIFQVSNVTGEGLELLRTFINLLSNTSQNKYDSQAPAEFQITDTFSVPGVGTVVSGTITSGIIHVGDTLLLGPDTLGNFVPTVIKSIHRKRVNVPCASAGQSASFALKKVKRAAIRKGMVMLSKSLDPKASFEFDAEILVLYHSTTIKEKYQAMLHCGGVRQTARIVNMDKQILRTGDRAIVRFRFLQHPEYIKPGSKVLFREGRTKGVGKVVGVV
ncbi:Short integuments 2, mitochondrial [Kappamyces sp. JEL0829]|nr:Short integuments 2, mitochondrial [Kappamyces sp. JEL0829]